MSRFTNKIVVVIGGTSGIGAASVRAFLDEGASVVLTGRNAETVASVATDMGSSCHGIAADISSADDSAALFQSIRDRFGRIDTLFVNAGVGAFLPIEQVRESHWDHILGTNLKGAYFCIQHALPLMSKGGSVLVCGSAGHRKALAGNSVYSASKAGLRAVVRTLGLELLDRGIRVNFLSPGPIDTPIIDKAADGDADKASSIRQHMAAAVPMRRLGHPEEVAKAALFLASDDASFITGIDLPVDGGLTSF